MALEELKVLKRVCQILDEEKIHYMITGSIATNFYALPRMTRDIDIVIEIKTNDVDRIVEAFEDDFYIDRESVSDAVHQLGMFNIVHNESVIKIDFMVRKKSPYRDLEFQRRRRIKIGGTRIWIVSPEDLVLSKLFWAKESQSEIQLKDIKNILSTVQGIDLSYIEHWVQSLGVQEIYQKVRP